MQEYLLETVLGACIVAVAGLFARVRGNESKLGRVDERVGALEKSEDEVSDLAKVTIRLEERVRHLPTHADLQLLHNRISSASNATGEVEKSVAALTESIKGVRTAVDRLHRVEEGRERGGHEYQ